MVHVLTGDSLAVSFTDLCQMSSKWKKCSSTSQCWSEKYKKTLYYYSQHRLQATCTFKKGQFWMKQPHKNIGHNDWDPSKGQIMAALASISLQKLCKPKLYKPVCFPY